MLLGTFVVSVFALCGAVSLYYPDKISVPKQYEDGLEAELGGPRAVRVRHMRRGLQTKNGLTYVGKEIRGGHEIRYPFAVAPV